MKQPGRLNYNRCVDRDKMERSEADRIVLAWIWSTRTTTPQDGPFDAQAGPIHENLSLSLSYFVGRDWLNPWMTGLGSGLIVTRHMGSIRAMRIDHPVFPNTKTKHENADRNFKLRDAFHYREPFPSSQVLHGARCRMRMRHL